MPDPLRPLRPGDSLPTSIQAWNPILDAARARRSGEGGGDSARDHTRHTGIVKLLNDSGADVDRFGVLGLAGPIFTPTDSEESCLREVAFRGATPAAEHAGRFAVTLEPIRDGTIGRAWVSGVCPARVLVVDADHRWVGAEPDETGMLVSAPTGYAQILWCEGDDGAILDYGAYETGEQWAYIRLGSARGGALRIRVQLTEAIADDTSAEVSAYGAGTVTVYNRSGTTINPDGDTKIGYASWMEAEGEYQVDQEACDAGGY